MSKAYGHAAVLLALLGPFYVSAEDSVEFYLGPGIGNAKMTQVVTKENGILTKAIFTLRFGNEVQKIEIDPALYENHVDVDTTDYSGDGYADLTFPLIYGPGPFAQTEMWVFDQKSHTFERNESFTGEGFPVKSTDKHCIATEVRGGEPPEYQYMKNQYCYDISTKEWVFVKDWPSSSEN